MRFSGARGEGTTAWATGPGVDYRERVHPAIFRELLARNLGSHDRDVPFSGNAMRAVTCDMTPSPIPNLTRTRGGTSTHTLQAIPPRILARTLHEGRIPHEEESAIPFLEGTAHGSG